MKALWHKHLRLMSKNEARKPPHVHQFYQNWDMAQVSCSGCDAVITERRLRSQPGRNTRVIWP